MKKIFLLIVCTLVLSNSVFSQLENISKTNISDNLYGVKFVNQKIGMAVGWNNTSGTIIKTTDGGVNWEILNAPKAFLFCINMIDSNMIFCAGYSRTENCGIVYKSTDGGINWDIQLFDGVSNPYSFGFYQYIIKENSFHYLCGYQGAIFKSSDAGKTWVRTNTPDQVSTFRGCDFANANVGFASCDTAGGFSDLRTLYKTTNGGENWNRVTTIPTYTVIASIACIDINTTLLFGYSLGTEAVLKTTDGGTTWKKILSGKNQMAFQFGNFKDRNLGVTVGDGGNVYLTKDGGENWTKYTNSSMPTILSSSFLSDNFGYFVGLQGAIWKFDQTTGINQFLGSEQNINLYPNPTSYHISISYSNLANSVQSIILTNSMGVEIKRIENKELDERSSINISTESLPSGIYYCTLNIGTNKMTKSFVVIK